jgi:cobalt-zinc-cadmium efflux system outer membrane protein
MRINIIILLISFLSTAINGQSKLEQYQKIALEQNPSLLASYKMFESAMERVSQVNALPDPTLSIGYFISPVETRVGPQRARLSLNQMFPWFGTLKAQGDVAALEANAQFEQFVEQQNSIKYDVARAYYPLIEVKDLSRIYKENIEFVKTLKSLVTIQFENNKSSLADVLRVELLLQQLDTDLQILIEKEKPLKIAFNRLLNRQDTTSIALDSLAINQSQMVMENNWEEHPLIKELNLKMEATDKRIEVINKSSMPKIGVGVDYVIIGKRTDMSMPDNGKNALMPMVSVSLPIFRKKYKSAQKEQSLRLEAYEFSSEATKNNLATKYEQLIYELEKEHHQLDLFEKLETQTLQINRLMMSEYRNSASNIEGLLQVQMQLLKYQQQKVKATVNFNTIVANIEYITAK